MGWTWTYTNESGTTVSPASGTDEAFASQADAESWIGENFRTLLDEGVDTVTLLEDGSVTYEMSLHPE
jgi:hypothetical protein